MQCIVGYCYKYTRATYDCFVLQGHILSHYTQSKKLEEIITQFTYKLERELLKNM